MLKTILIDKHQVSIDNLYVTGDLVFLVILLGKVFSSPKWCYKIKLHPKIQLEHGHKIGEAQTINTLRLVSEAYSTGSARLGVKEVPIWEFVEVDKYICPFFRIRLIWVKMYDIIYLIMEMNIQNRLQQQNKSNIIH